MKIEVLMLNHGLEEVFSEARNILQQAFDRHNVLPRANDTVSCNNGICHRVDSVQWLGFDTITVWIRSDFEYIQRHKVSE